MMMMTANRVSLANDQKSSNKLVIHKELVSETVTIVEQWNHTKRCRFIERVLPLCNSDQVAMLWTVLQPSLHRDYFYAVKLRYPNYHFKQISTPDTRALKKGKHHRTFDREDSFYLSDINDLGELRENDGLTRESQTVFAQYSNTRLLPSVRQSNGINRTAYHVDINIENVRRQRISSQLTTKTTKSVAVRCMNQLINSAPTIVNTNSLEQLLSLFSHSWSESDQNDFLRRLIVKFDERQQYFISCVIIQRRYRDFICLLPLKISFHILNYLTVQDLSRCRQVCKYWKSIIDRERDLWKPKSKPDEKPSIQTDWKTFQKQRSTIKRHWLTGTAHVIKCAGHSERVLCICGNPTHLATGSLDRTIIIWTLNDGTLCQTLRSHTKDVWSLKFLSSAILISGSYDATIKIWNINTAICLRTLLSHKGPVWSLACSNGFCLSGSQDRTARLWLLPKCELHATLTGHTLSVFAVDLNPEQNLCATSSADKTVRIWSLTTTQCVKVLHATTDDYIMSVSLQHGFIAYAFGVHITIYRVTVTEIRPCTVQKIMESQEHRGRVEGVQLVLLSDEDKQPSLVSAGQDGSIKYWDLTNNTSQHTYNTQSDEVVKINSIYADRTHIATVGDDGLVNILDFASQRHES